MKRGFYTIMAAQFFSSLADNALLVAAIELLQENGAPAWQVPALAPMFALFYVLLAPFVGAFADAMPKGRVMFASNAIKVVGCLMMLFGVHPLFAYAIVGLGAAAYSPAKYGILTELLPPSQLVRGNGWIEGLTVTSIVLGILIGGQLIGPRIAPHLMEFDLPMTDFEFDSAPQVAIGVIIVMYLVATVFNLAIPRTEAPLQALPKRLWALVGDFRHCNRRLWHDKLGQISLATTTLLWGIFGNLRIIVFAWAAAALGYATTEASNLAGVVIVGSVIGALAASLTVKLDKAVRLLWIGVAIGVLIIGLDAVRSIHVASPFLILVGAVCGYLIVPMNALLQHRGHNLMGAGRSIAVQNFNEQACILALGALYTGMSRLGMSAFTAIAAFGILVTVVMVMIQRWHQRNLRDHGPEVERLLAIARTDGH